MKRDRLERVLQHIQAQGTVTTAELTGLFGVSEMTIRRDLMTLERQGKILRFHGGASMRKNEEMEAAFEIRVNANQSCKKAVGAAAVTYLTEHLPSEPAGSVFLGSGSTIYCMATQMNAPLPVPVITDNTYVANTLAADPQNAVILIGGQLILPSLNATGYIAEKMISDFTIDQAFISSSAIDEQGDLYTYNLLEAGVFSAVIAASKQVIVLADHSKLGKKNLVHLCSLNERFTLITDSGTPAKTLARCRELGAEVIAVPVPEA